MSVYLTDDRLGRLDLGPLRPGGGVRLCNEEGYVVTGWEIGFPEVREVSRYRALADGVLDDSQFLGARAVSMNITLDVNKQDPQTSIDRLMSFMTPHVRPRLHWTIPGSAQIRSMIVRGADAPVSIQGKQAHVVSVQWVGVNGSLEAADRKCSTIVPGDDVETGRTYDLTFDRTYPPGTAIGRRIVQNDGNEVAEWEAAIYGDCLDPVLTINGIRIEFDYDLQAGQSIYINSRDRTILLNIDPFTSVYGSTNFTEWSWESVRLQPGENVVQFNAASINAGAQAVICWRDTWL